MRQNRQAPYHYPHIFRKSHCTINLLPFKVFRGRDYMLRHHSIFRTDMTVYIHELCVIYQCLNVGIKMQMSNKLWGTCPKKKGAWSVQCLFELAVFYVWEDYTCKLYSSKCAEKYRHFRHLILFVCKEARECQLLTFKLQKITHYFCLLSNIV